MDKSKFVLERLREIKKTLPDRETFAKALVKHKAMRHLASFYGWKIEYLLMLRKELFGDMPIEEVKELGKALLAPPITPNKDITGLVETKTYKIVDIAAFEAGGHGTYDGLEYVGTEKINEMERALRKINWGEMSISGANPHRIIEEEL